MEIKPGWTLSIDPASRKAGVSLWFGDVYIASEALSSSLVTWSERANDLRIKLQAFISRYVPKNEFITLVVIELVPKIVEPSVQLIAGAIIAEERYKVNPTRKCFVSPSSWKAFARKNGCKEKDPKGVSALKDIGWDFDINPVTSDDVADSILIYLTWLRKNTPNDTKDAS